MGWNQRRRKSQGHWWPVWTNQGLAFWISPTQKFPVPSAQMNYRGPSPGSLLSFNINDGYADGILRGYKLGLLGQTDFANLSQCDVIDGTVL